MSAIEYLARLEYEAEQNHTQELYLWPRTPISNLQAEIWQRVGASDWQAHIHCSRPYNVLRAIGELIENQLIPASFSFVDICCGDALIPWHVKREHPFATCCGVDINKDRLPLHALVQDMGVLLFRIPIQRLFRDGGDIRFDVALMFNTYRGWDSADLSDGEQWIVDAADEWFHYRAQYTILTVTDAQIERLKADGWWVTIIGRGEDDSKMILMWPCATGKLEGFWREHRE